MPGDQQAIHIFALKVFLRALHVSEAFGGALTHDARMDRMVFWITRQSREQA